MPSVQSSGQPCKMEFSVFCPGSSYVLRAEQLQPCTALLLAWLIITPRTKELLGSTVIIHSLHSWVLRTRAIKTAYMMSIGQQTTASWYWCDLPNFDNVKQTWLLLLRCKMDLKYAVQVDTDDPWWLSTLVSHLRFIALYWLTVNFLKVWCLEPHCIGVLRGISVLRT